MEPHAGASFILSCRSNINVFGLSTETCFIFLSTLFNESLSYQNILLHLQINGSNLNQEFMKAHWLRGATFDKNCTYLLL